MSELRTLYRQSSHYVAGRVLVILLGFISFPLFTRIFSVAEYGLLSLVLKIVAMVTVLSKLGVQNSILRFYGESVRAEDGRSLPRFYSTVFFGVLASAVVVASGFAGMMLMISGRGISSEVAGLLALGSGLIVTRSLHSMLWGFLRVEGRTKLYNVMDVTIKSATIAVVCLLLFYWERSLGSFLGGSLLVETAAVAGLGLFFASRGLLKPGQIDPYLYRSFISYGFPLIGYEFASVLIDSGDRVLVQHFLGPVALGYYSAAYNLSAYLEEALMMPLNLALIPAYMRIWAEKGEKATVEFLSGALSHFVMAAAAVACAITVTAHDLVVFLGSRKLAAASGLLPILVVGLLIYATHIFLNAGLLIRKKTGVMARTISMAMVAKLGLTAVFLPLIGLQAAALATVAAYALFAILTARASLPLLRLRVPWMDFARYGFAASASAAVISWLSFGSSAFVNLVLKGSLSLLAYAALVWLMVPQVRAMARRLHSAIPARWLPR